MYDCPTADLIGFLYGLPGCSYPGLLPTSEVLAVPPGRVTRQQRRAADRRSASSRRSWTRGTPRSKVRPPRPLDRYRPFVCAEINF